MTGVSDIPASSPLPVLALSFCPAEAKRVAERPQVHYTLKHASWLDVAEIELAILARQCLSRRIDNMDDLRQEATAWEVARDIAGTKIDWQFRTENALVTLRKLRPSIGG